MSHFYRQRSYTFSETDEMLTDIRKEMSNFITKEEAEIIWNRRFAIVDPPPYWYGDSKVQELLIRIEKLTCEVISLKYELESIKNDNSFNRKEFDEPTM
jgi:hypothetical protein